MRDSRRYIGRWLGALVTVLLLVACSKSSEDDGPQQEKPVLKIYVFAPDHPIVTRGDNGDVDASAAEKKIHNLHVWVFEHDNGKYVGHISLSNVEFSETTGNEVTMELSDAFADAETKPNVDVYVAANVTAANCGITLSATTTRQQLEDALIKENYFGVSNLISTVPADGLPMSGVMKNKQIKGTSPVYQVVEESGTLANVRLVRAVSKIRFVFSKSTSNPDEVAVNSVTLNSDVFPNQEYLFLGGVYPDVKSHVNTAVGYVTETPLVSSVTAIKSNESPASYSWDGKISGQEYETLIQTGIDLNKLSDLGTFYLRESDKALAGKIRYTINHREKNGDLTTTEKTPVFSMKEDGDFSRNHTWIVYAYFVSSGDLIVGIVEVKDWTNSEDHSQMVYNW
jgi:hypothetical protein